MKTILVTGGAGYIGSHTCRLLNKNGYRIAVLDSLEHGHIGSLNSTRDLNFIRGCIGNKELLDDLFQAFEFDAVVHFAAYTYVGESVKEPGKYYRNNFSAPLVLLDAMVKYNCKKLVFSSTCATYGDPQQHPLDETHPQNPLNPYGRSKLFFEQAVMDYQKAYGLAYVFLRYFNASGAAKDGSIGEDHDPETHLIPLVLKNIKGEIPDLKVFGNDYPTADGTCIRDYIHVDDLASAHLKALEYLGKGGRPTAFNLGTGQGNSVLEVIRTAEKVTGKAVGYSFSPKRPGDAVSLVANADKASELMGWKADVISLEEIIASAWKWENGPLNGRYEK